MNDTHAHVYEQPKPSKISKAEANYTDVAPLAYKDEPCRTCTFFERLEKNHCSRVVGIIKKQGHCKLWKSKNVHQVNDSEKG